MHAAADAGGDENMWQTCATVAQAAVLVRAAMGCTAVANCRCECTGRCRTVCTAGARRMASSNRLEIHTAWSVCTAVRKVLCKDAHQIRAAVGAPAGARAVRTAAVCLDAELGDGRCPDGELLCDDVAAMVVHTCWPWLVIKRASCCQPCAWDGARRVAKCTARLRFELRGRCALSCAQCCVRMPIRCTRLPIPVATRMHI